MPLGDSLTLGSMDQRGYSDSYRKALWQFLQKRNFRHIDFVGNREDDDGTFDGNHSGWGGFKSQSDTPVPSGTDPGTLYAYIEKYIPQPFTLNDGTGMDWVTFANPDIVLLNIGTNDGDSDSDVISHRLRLLVDVILAKAPTARVILSSLPPSGGNIAITPLVGVEARKLALASGGRIFYADIRTRMLRGNASLGAAPFAQSDWREDLTHLSQSGGPKFAAAWLPTVEAALKAPRCA